MNNFTSYFAKVGSGPLGLEKTTQALGLWVLLGWLSVASAGQSGDYMYTTSGNEVTITRYTGDGGELVIPSQIDGLPVTAIGADAFIQCGALTSVVVPESVSAIGDRAFRQCTSLRQITLPSQLRSLGAWALSNCEQLETVELPSSLTNLADQLFYGSGLVRIRLPEGISAIGNAAFQFSIRLVEIEFPASLVSLGPNAFANCVSLREAKLPANLQGVGSGAFQNCINLTNVDIGPGVKTIEGEAFQGCTGLESVILPDNVESLDSSAFESCSQLKRMMIGRGLKYLSPYSVIYCPNFQAFEVAAQNPFYASQDGVLFNQALTQLICYPVGRTNTSYQVPFSVTHIGTNAFMDSLYLGTVSFGQVETIENYAFFYSSLETLTNAGSLKHIGDSAFASCGRLKNVSLSPGLLRIGPTAFGACAKLTSVVMPSSVTNLGAYAFAQCAALSLVELSPGINTIGERAFAGTGLSTLVIPHGVEKIGDSAFAGSSLQVVVIPSSVQSLGWLAFGDCPGLKSVYFQGFRPWLNDANVYGNTPGVTQYYLANTPGWGAVFADRPAEAWPLRFLENDGRLGLREGQFGFTTCWGNGATVVVEACTNIMQPVWVPVATNVLAGGSVDFRDAQWTNAPQRFYRLKKL